MLRVWDSSEGLRRVLRSLSRFAGAVLMRVDLSGIGPSLVLARFAGTARLGVVVSLVRPCFVGAPRLAEVEVAGAPRLAEVEVAGAPRLATSFFVGMAVSLITSFASLSSRIPSNEGWRITPSSVISRKETSHTRRGFNQVAFASGGSGRKREGLLTSGITPKGEVFWISGLNCFIIPCCIFSVKPVPIFPVYCNLPSSNTPTNRELNNLGEPSLRVKPPMTTSCRLAVFILSHSLVLTPGV